jgi:PAS domain S-box-containing protein
MPRKPTYEELEKLVKDLEKEPTERIQAEEAYHNLVKRSPMGMHFYELQDHDRLVFVGANPAADRLLGVDNQVFVGKTIEEAFPPLSQTEVPERYRQAARHGIPWATEQINYEDQQIVGAFEVRAFRISPNKMAAEFTDITHRKKVEKALKESEERYRLMTENVADVLWTMDMNLNFTYISPSIENLRGYTVDEAMVQALKDTMLPDSLVVVMELVGQKLVLIESGDDEGWSPVIFEAEQYCKDGTTIWSQNNARFLPGPDEKPVSILGVSRDITERKQAEVALRQSEEKYRTMIERSNDMIWTIDTSGSFTFFNKQTEEVTGLKLKDWIGKSFVPLILEEDLPMIMDIFKNVLEGKSDKYEFRFRKQENEILTIIVSTAPLWIDGKVSGVVSFGRDITGKKLAEEEKANLETQLQQSQKMESIGTLAGGIAHDFNNILFPMFGYLEMMLEDMPEDNPHRGKIAKVFKGALRARDLVRQILTFSRQAEHETKPLKVQHVLKEVLKLIRSTLPTTIGIHQDISNECDSIMADPTQIHQIAMNLMTNAYHAMENTGGTLKVSLKEVELAIEDITGTAMNPGPHVCLTVADTGPGMDNVTVDRIFDPYFTTKEEGKGTGLGLAVVHGIVKSYGGHINVKSEPGMGTEFKVYLPLIRPQGTVQKTITDLPIQKGTERILLVDDQDEIVQLSGKMLERLGYNVTTRTSSVEALEAFRTQPDKFDLVITDMTMPNMTGDKLAGELIKIRSDIPIVLCTGFSEGMSEERAASLGIKGFLMKPVVMKELSSEIRKALGKK